MRAQPKEHAIFVITESIFNCLLTATSSDLNLILRCSKKFIVAFNLFFLPLAHTVTKLEISLVYYF